jgi:hypothetical protein
MMEMVRIFEVGAEGGGCEVFRYENGIVIEKGSSGGMLDEDEDPFVSWEKKYGNFEHWFKEFKIKHKDFWIYLYPVYISEEIRSFVMEEVKNYLVPKEEIEWFFERRDDWFRALGMKDDFSHQG